jgi:hypothetical protein
VSRLDLRPCPCGQTPDDLVITGDGSRPKWATAAGNCCTEWDIEFRNGYLPLASDECRELAAEAWNSAPRGRQ